MLTMEMVLHKDVDFAPKFGKNLKFRNFLYTSTQLHLISYFSVFYIV